jgi:hypothetical protein
MRLRQQIVQFAVENDLAEGFDDFDEASGESGEGEDGDFY